MALILIADDSPTSIFSIKQMLEENGHLVITAEDGEQAVEMTLSELPDLILMDIIMPKLNGFQATRRLSKTSETAAIPIIIISAKDQETDRLWGLRQGARDYMAKPLDEPVLMDKINQLLIEN